MTYTKQEARVEASRLRAEITRHDHLYYVEHRPEISDGAYDRLFRVLQTIEKAFPQLLTADSPTQRVGADPLPELRVKPHVVPMLSLDSSEAEEDVRRFDERVRKVAPEPVEYLVEPKLDGSSLELVYVDGVLDRAVTRGNGVEGELVTENARTIRSVPLRLRTGGGEAQIPEPRDGREMAYVPADRAPGSSGGDPADSLDDRATSGGVPPASGDALPIPSLLAVRGEVLMYLSSFEELNRSRVEAGLEPYANPRNAAAGALRQLDSRITRTRPLEFFAYDILRIEETKTAAPGTLEEEEAFDPGKEPVMEEAFDPAEEAVEEGVFGTDEEAVEALRGWGLRLPDRTRKVANIEEAIAYHADFARDRDALDFEIDGVVLKLNARAPREDLGSTSHHPRWAFAFKFAPRQEVTRLERIAVQVGRTGKLTPVALLRPVEVGGVTVSRASLHNREELERKDVREGDLVRIQRAGDVIPQVVERVEEPGRERAQAFQMPDECPRCGAAVAEEGPFIVCSNQLGCPAQLERGIEHFVSRAGLDIEGLGSETVALLVDQGRVRQLADIFGLQPEDFLTLEGFAEKSSKLVDTREGGIGLQGVIEWLGIPGVGPSRARHLAIEFGELQSLLEATAERLEKMGGVGPVAAKRIIAFLQDETRAPLLDKLVSKGSELDVSDLLAFEGFADKSRKLVDAIQQARHVELARFIYGLGIPEVGATVARVLATEFRDLESLREATAERLEEVEGIGPIMSEKITGFFHDDARAASLDAILSKGFELVPPPERESRALEGTSFVFSGRLESITRSEARERIQSLGGRVVSSVSSATGYLVKGERAGSKAARAEKLGVTVLDEDAFLKLLET